MKYKAYSKQNNGIDELNGSFEATKKDDDHD